MRVGIDILFEQPGQSAGGETYLLGFLRALADINQGRHKYFLFVNSGNADFYAKVIDNIDFTLVRLPGSNKHKWFRFLTQQVLIPYYVKRHHIDVIGFLGNTSALLLPCASALHVRSLHCFWTPEQLQWHRRQFLRRMIKASAKRANLVIANSNYLQGAVHNMLAVPLERTMLVREAVEHSLFHPLEQSPQRVAQARLQQTYGIKRPYILFISTLYPYKNADKLLRAFAQLVREHNTEHQLVIVGGDYLGHMSSLKDLASELDIASRVIFTGHIADRQVIRNLYAMADVFIYPSSFETFGLPILEAMACGTPVIGSNRTSVPETMSDAGLVVDPDNQEEFAKGIHRVLTDQRLRETLIKKGLNHTSQFNWERTAQETVLAYEKALHRHNNSSSTTVSQG